MSNIHLKKGVNENAGKWAIFEHHPDGSETLLDVASPEWYVRQKAAALEWAAHLNTWMTSVVEDEDVVEEIGELLGIMAEIDFESTDEEYISKAYDRMIAEALKYLPQGLRVLADRYEREWKAVHDRVAAG